MKPHALMHSLTGLGIGLLLAGLLPTVLAGNNGIILGIIVVVAGVLGDFMVNK